MINSTVSHSEHAQTCEPLAEVTGIILAGGRGSRMGGEDKGLMMLNGLPLYQHVQQRLQPQVARICISANRNIERYQQSGQTVFSDTLAGFAGPLAGMLTALHAIHSEWALFTACDTPFIPLLLAKRLWQEKGDASAVWTQSNGRDHPTVCLVHRSQAEHLERFLQRGDRKLMLFFQTIEAHAVSFNEDPRAFININTPDDLRSWQQDS